MYSYQPKHPLLKPYIKQIIQFKGSPHNFSSMTVVPTGNVFLALFWGDGSYLTQRPNATVQTESGGLFVSGQQLEIAHFWVKEGEINIVGFELTPDAIHQFFNIPQHETTGQIIRLEDIWHKDASLFLQKVIDQPDPDRQLIVIEEFLCQRIISKQWKENATITEAIYLLRQSNGNLGIPALADSLRMSSRTLQRKFLQAVGISPKAYGNIIRFNYAFKQCLLYKKHVLDVVSEAGYYDQPHFVHHFKKVFGISPGQFFEAQEKALNFLQQEEEQHSMRSLVDTLTHLQKLYVY